MQTILRELEIVAVEKVVSFSHHDLNRYFFALQPNALSVVIHEIQRDINFTQKTHKTSTHVPPPRINHQQPTFQHRYPSPPKYSNPPRFMQQNLVNYSKPPTLPPKPTVRPSHNFIPNASSGRHANTNVFRPNNFRPNNAYVPSKMQISHNYRDPLGTYRNYPNHNGYQNQYRPPRPTTAHPPTPMETNYHFYEPYYDNEYHENYYDHYPEYPDEYPDNYDYSYEKTEYSDELPNMSNFNLENQNEKLNDTNENFPQTASTSQKP